MSTLGLLECFTSNDWDLCKALVGVGSSNFYDAKHNEYLFLKKTEKGYDQKT